MNQNQDRIPIQLVVQSILCSPYQELDAYDT